MKRNVKAPEIEARLHRSLMKQVRVPQLDRRFDAGVWARIEAQEQAQAQALAAPVSRRSGAEKWLVTSNIVGIVVAAVLVLFFGLRMFSGAEVEVPIPDFSGAEGQQAAQIFSWTVATVAVGVAAMFTPVGRWLRAEFT